MKAKQESVIVITRLCYQLTFITIIYFLLIGCNSNFQSPKTVIAETIQTRKSFPNNSVNSFVDRSIRRVDFGNFRYPWPSDLIAPKKPHKMFTLRNGVLAPTKNKRGFIDEMGVHLEKTIYGDTTADGIEEAIIILSIVTGGSALPNCIYIYTWRSNQPLLLWSSVRGDRADDGLRNIQIENGKVLIEIYSPIDKKGDCCPKYFRRVWLTWVGKRFKQNKEETLLPNNE
jgi:hypothetical protein